MALIENQDAVCTGCRKPSRNEAAHTRALHVSWGGQPHQHWNRQDKSDLRECSLLHVYCMVADCHCSGVIQ